MAGDLPPATADLVATLVAGQEPTNEQGIAAAVELVGIIVRACTALERIATALEEGRR